MTSPAARHPRHVGHQDTRGVVRCAYQNCQAAPATEDAAEETAARMRVVIDFRAHA